MTEEAPAGIGHNSGAEPAPYDPVALDEATALVSRAQEAAAKWKPVAIEDADTAAKLNDFLGGLRKTSKKVDDVRAKAKKVHDDAGKKVQAAFLPLLSALETMQEEVKAKLTKFAKLEAERQRAAAEAQRQAAEVERLRSEAEAAKAAARGDLIGQAAAQQAAEEMAAVEAAAQNVGPVRIGSATGAGRTAAMRTEWRATIVNPRLAFLAFENHPDMMALLERLANAAIRGADDKASLKIPGVTFTSEQKVA